MRPVGAFTTRALGTLALVLSLSAASAAALDELVDRLDAIRGQGGVPAFAVVLVDREGVRLSAQRGLADLEAQRPVGPRTRFRIGSITKAFTGTALLIAEAEGILSLDAPVARLVPAPPYSNPWSDTHPITVAQLLEHTAGFQDWVRDEWDLNDPLPLGEALAFRPASRTARWPPALKQRDPYHNKTCL